MGILSRVFLAGGSTPLSLSDTMTIILPFSPQTVLLALLPITHHQTILLRLHQSPILQMAKTTPSRLSTGLRRLATPVCSRRAVVQHTTLVQPMQTTDVQHQMPVCQSSLPTLVTAILLS